MNWPADQHVPAVDAWWQSRLMRRNGWFRQQIFNHFRLWSRGALAVPLLDMRVRMNSDWSDERNSPDTLYVPFVWVPDGAPEPTEWLAQHPEAFWVTATLVRGGSSDDDTDPKPDNLDQPPSAVDAGNADLAADLVRAYSRGAPLPKRTGGFAGTAGPHYLRERPVAAYLRINEMFRRMGIENSARHDGAETALPETISKLPAPSRPTDRLAFFEEVRANQVAPKRLSQPVRNQNTAGADRVAT